MALASTHSSSSALFFENLLLFISIFGHGILIIGIDAYYLPTHRHCTSSSFATTSPSFVYCSNRQYLQRNNLQKRQQQQNRRGSICNCCNEESMLRIGNKFIIQTTAKSIQSANRTFLFASPQSSLFGMSSRKRPMPPPSSSFVITTCSSDSAPPTETFRRKKMTTTAPLNQRTNDNIDMTAELPRTETKQQQCRPLVIVLAGPTAVGKSDVAAELCSPATSSDISRGHFHSSLKKTSPPIAASDTCYRGHVVSADSVQAYRGVDIGANKPTADEMERTPHHLVNVVDPPTDPSKASSYNAADWMRDARYVIRELTSHDGDDDEDDDPGEGREEGGDEKGTVLNHEALVRRESIEKTLIRSLDVSNDNDNSNGTPANGRPSILPVVVGGTMMYLQWLVHGRPDAIRPTAEAVERAADKIDGFRREADAMAGKTNVSSVQSSDEGEATTEGDASDNGEATWNTASGYVSSLGPVFARRVDKLPGRDWYRLRRLLEVAYTMASKHVESTKKEEGFIQSKEEILRRLTERELYTGIRSGSLADLGYDVRCFFLCPDERMAHFHTVDQRCEQMLLRGLLRETAALHVEGGLPDASQVTRAIGYRQALEYLNRADARRGDKEAFSMFVTGFATATRQYAKKQMQWFRRDTSFAFIPVRMEWEKTRRVADATQTIAEMCKLSPEEFEAELSSGAKTNGIVGSGENNGHGDNGGVLLPLSARTKLDNERQGKNMKFFLSKRTRLVDGSDDFSAVLAEADECTKRVQGLGEDF